MKTKVWLMLLVLIVIIFACEDDESVIYNEIIPDDLVGTWISESKDIIFFGNTVEFHKYTFTKADPKNGICEFYWIADYPNVDTLLIMSAWKSTFKVKNNMIMFQEILQIGSEIGAYNIGGFVLNITDTTEWFFPGDAEFDYVFNQEGEKIESIVFEILGNTLLFKFDNNSDGDYEDEYEVSTFIRED